MAYTKELETNSLTVSILSIMHHHTLLSLLIVVRPSQISMWETGQLTIYMQSIGVMPSMCAED